MTRWLTAFVVTLGVLAVPAGAAAAGPRYDVPRGYTRCADAVAWNGFFKWASARHTTCAATARFMRTYAARAADAPTMPRHVAGYTCRIHYWRDAEGNRYASRHVCTRGEVTIRFYGMV